MGARRTRSIFVMRASVVWTGCRLLSSLSAPNTVRLSQLVIARPFLLANSGFHSSTVRCYSDKAPEQPTAQPEADVTAAKKSNFFDGLSKNYQVVKVSTTSPVSKLGASIARMVGEKHKVVVSAVGASSCNQAAKGLAVARKFLSSQGDYGFQAKLSPHDQVRQNMLLFVVEKPAVTQEADQVKSNVVVLEKAPTHKIGAAIAMKIRANESVTVSCVSLGASTVFRAIQAITVAREFLKRDNLEVSAFPEFVSVESKLGPRTTLKFHLLASTVQPTNTTKA
eukprot:c1380_g1_i1.p1 GENE.c1380_g1_i1~~c1380_g1_i1.p1  ORF type:complete len:281 (-),score=39.32 c1380_g1_i1:20-862(-)